MRTTAAKTIPLALVLLLGACGVKKSTTPISPAFAGSPTCPEAIVTYGDRSEIPSDYYEVAFIEVVQAAEVDIVSNDQAGVRQILGTYKQVTDTTVAEGWQIEGRRAAAWPGNRWDPDEIAKRRQAVVDRGRSQQG